MLYGLLRKRAEVAGEIDALRTRAAMLVAGLDHIDATIRLFKPDIDLADLPIKPLPPPSAAFRGEVQRFLLDTLRNASTAMTTHELATAIMLNRGLALADRVLFKLISSRTGHSLAKMRDNGMVTSERMSKVALLRWQIAGASPAGG